MAASEALLRLERRLEKLEREERRLEVAAVSPCELFQKRIEIVELKRAMAELAARPASRG